VALGSQITDAGRLQAASVSQPEPQKGDRKLIDRLEGRIRLWDNQIAMSSVVITLTEPAPIAASTGGPLPTLVASFAVAGENFVLTVAGLVAMSGSALPVMLLLAGPVWLAGRAWRRTRAAGAPAAQEQASGH
jgi:hypothetical protein